MKNGLNGSNIQKYLCKESGHKYTSEPKANGIQRRCTWSYGSIVQVLKLNPQSLMNLVQSYFAKLPPAPLPIKVKKAELDELYTLTIVDRDICCVLSWDVVSSEALQACLKRASQAKQSYSDAFPVNETLYYYKHPMK